MTIGLPQINIIFRELANTAIERGERGIVALFLKDSAANGNHTIVNVNDIPSELSVTNKKQIELALMGGVKAPLKVLVHVSTSDAEDWTTALGWAETVKFDYLAIPTVQTGELVGIKTWITTQRELGKKVKAILPNYAGDSEAIINFTASNIVVGETTYTTTEYCSRIAGLIAGTPLTMSTTYQPLNEIDSVDSLTISELNEAIGKGEFVLFHDGEKVKVGRGVTSFQTTTTEKGESFKKIKIVDTIDLMEMDIKKTLSDKYIGKYPNTYDNKVLLLTAIQTYYKTLEAESLLDENKNTVGVDITSQRSYLQSKGVDVDKMTDQEIKEANTNDKVFLESNIKIVDAMEDINLGISI